MTRTRNDQRRVRPKGARGFSLIEVIAVVAIVGVMGALAVVSTSSTYQSRQRAVANQIAGELRFVRELALSTGRNHWAYVNPGTEVITYWQTAAGAAKTGAAATSLLDALSGTQMTTSINVSSTSSTSVNGVAIGQLNGSTSAGWLGFDARGRPVDSAGTLLLSATTLTITASTGSVTYSAITLTIQADTGLVTITY